MKSAPICLVKYCLFFLSFFFITQTLYADEVNVFFQQGVEYQKNGQTKEAIELYQKALQLNPDFAEAHYEIGWSYWVLGKWKDVVFHWRKAKKLGFEKEDFEDSFKIANARLKGKGLEVVRVAMGTSATAQFAAKKSNNEEGEMSEEPQESLSMQLVARFQQYNNKPESESDHYDTSIFSPKSVTFSLDGKKAYVNSLEGLATVVYDTTALQKIKVIMHRFNQNNRHLFIHAELFPSWATFLPTDEFPNPNTFYGKPVEFASSHNGRYLWVSYYRRHFDKNALYPSAIGLIDTETDTLVRVMNVGPIPKFMAVSPDNKYLATIHWGDNTVGLINIEGNDINSFHHEALINVGKPLDLKSLPEEVQSLPKEKIDRDKHCGSCLRGAVFTPDGHYLLVGMMHGGGIAIVDVEKKKYIGSVYGMKPTPRHLVLSNDGQTLYVSSNISGYVSSFSLPDIIDTILSGRHTIKPLQETKVGKGARTISLSKDEKLLFSAINYKNMMVALDPQTLKILLKIPVDSYPVGLAVSPDSKQVWITSQGKMSGGGNSVSVYSLTTSP
ncbi:MAG: tetratricopeptide repeat protein [Nitrospinae bacterium]|nr:tetratricopeptide repeat protein [Nitrospinota bacterium]